MTRMRRVTMRSFARFALAMVLCQSTFRAACAADPAADAQFPDAKSAGAAVESPAERFVLNGRITDETGAGVTDARVTLSSVEGNSAEETQSGFQGRYAFASVKRPGEYRLMIHSTRCLGFTDFNACPRLVLDARKPVVRDFKLRRACRLRIQTLDEQGRPVADVRFIKSRFFGDFENETDRQGWAMIGGLAPSAANYQLGVYSKDFTIARLDIKLDDPKVVVERKLVLKPGVTVKGTVARSDGAPLVGWRILALPSWWNIMSYPVAEPINRDGSFALHHVGPGAYNVLVFIPIDRAGGGTMRQPISNFELAVQQGPLSIKVDYPSAGSTASIAGKLRFIRGRPKRPYLILATSADGSRTAMQQRQHDDETFQIENLQPGRYRVTFMSQEIEATDGLVVVAPSQDTVLPIKLREQFTLRGTVVLPDGGGARDFRLRVVQLRALRGPTLGMLSAWRSVADPQGRFTEEVVGPGIYAIEATADGFSTTRSEPINTDRLPQQEIRLVLSRGASLAGTVLDDSGRPIEGATVFSLSSFRGATPLSYAEIPSGIGVNTVRGRFQLAGLNPGSDVLRIVHPDYAPVSKSIQITAGVQPRLEIVMKRGGTVQGHVQDPQGRLLPGVTLHFQDGPYGSESQRGRYASAITDENGYYEVHHLPERLVYIHLDREWDALGVVRQAILPADGKTRRLDFGGSSTVAGRLFVNGKPLAKTKVLLAGDDPNFSLVRATAMTDAEGAFVFSGIAVGERYLYFSVNEKLGQWVRVRALRIDSTARNFGRIEHTDGRVTVDLSGIPIRENEAVRANLSFNEGVAQRNRSAGIAVPHFAGKGPFVFEHVTPGRYRIDLAVGERFTFRSAVEMPVGRHDHTVSLEFPRGSAAIRGTIDPLLREGMISDRIDLRAKDDRFTTDVVIERDGRFEATSLPAGDYSLAVYRQLPNSSSTVTLTSEFSLRDRETKNLNLTPENMRSPEWKDGVMSLYVFTSDGIPLPGCEVKLTGANGPLSPFYINPDGCIIFRGQPGTYELAVKFPGFKPVTEQLELKIPDIRRSWADDSTRRVILSPIE